MSTQTWGYRPDGTARIFDLAPGDGLPEGWEASPACITNPDLATAEALSAAVEGRAYAAEVAEMGAVVATGADPIELANAMAEIDRLTDIIATGSAENLKLVAEIEAAESEMDKAAEEIVSLKAMLTKAQEDGGFAVAERDEAVARLDAMAADLAQARTDLEAATAPAPAKTAKAR